MKKLNLFQVLLICFGIFAFVLTVFCIFANICFSIQTIDEKLGLYIGSLFYLLTYGLLSIPLILKNSNKYEQKNANQVKISKNLYIFIFIAYCVMLLFEICKILYYSSHRQLFFDDYNEVFGCVVRLVLFAFWTLYIYTYNKNGNLRKGTFAFTLILCILLLLLIISSANTFSQLFFATEVYTPAFVDQFTSLFELVYHILFACVFICYFIYLIVKGYFKKQPTPIEQNSKEDI